MGSGTTNLVAKSLGYNSIGVEAHPFVHRIAKTKMNWDISFEELTNATEKIQKQLIQTDRPQKLKEHLEKEFPELILKCFLPEALFDLLIIRNSINQLKLSESLSEFLRTALICVLRDVSISFTSKSNSTVCIYQGLQPKISELTWIFLSGLQTAVYSGMERNPFWNTRFPK